MSIVIITLLAITLAAIVVVLLTGIIGMGRGGDFNAKYGNKLMRARVILQGLAIVLFLILIWVTSRG
ncbi:MAG: twin transmembrane helix small protein [Alphaproteobacteria bacterium]|nr:twin transmembrane helix small protein [Alphaproteobacteria bacterium]